MIIYVVPERWYKEHIPEGETLPVFQLPDSAFWERNNFINIRNSRSIDPNRGVPVNGAHILKLQFDDVRELPAVRRRPFDRETAERILDFIGRCDLSRPLYVNCSAGISRSGAVGETLNRYVNEILTDNEADRASFYRNNPQIDANPLVVRIMESAIEARLG
ncbi:MAG: hypothetical protein IJS14_08205 [Lentisphaeria bacterium]|nr:hypothetical protein [Lentisphaeria bacterium]